MKKLMLSVNFRLQCHQACLGLLLLVGGCKLDSPIVSPHSQPAAARVGTSANQPNFVYILVDDLDERITPYWQALPKTQALLQQRGLTFDNAFAPTPICCPARASVLTGKYGHNTGVLTNSGPYGGLATFQFNGNEERTIAKYLQEAGYRTMLLGKYLNGLEDQPNHIPPGWTEWYGAVDNLAYLGYGYTLNENGILVKYGFSEEDYITDVIRQKAISFIQQSEGDDTAPFFMYITPTAPHLPLPPAPRHQPTQWDQAEVPQLPNYFEPDLSDKPRWLKRSAEEREKYRKWTNQDYQNRMGSLLAVDEMIAGIIETLTEAGEMENTYFIFTSDNGYNNGAHYLIHKMAPYEESIRVPLVVAGPQVPVQSHTAAWALHIDLAPTLLDLAGLPIPTDMDGRSLASIFSGNSPANWRKDFLVQYYGGDAANGVGAELPPAYTYLKQTDIPSYKALRTEQYLYIEWYARDNYLGPITYELYDLTLDPYQLQNLLASKQGQQTYSGTLDKLKARMQALLACSGGDCQ